MRIIAGTKRGMNLLSPKNQVSRPITDRVKESLFSVLYKYDLPDGAKIADLFCGVGSLGLEALSRGAEFVLFVEQDRNIITILRKNIEKAGFIKNSKVIRANAFKIDNLVGINERRFDLVFVDPPYKRTKNVQPGSPFADLLDLLGTRINNNGVVIVRTSVDVSLPEQYNRLQVVERRQWGTMAVAILKGTNS